MRSRQTKKRLLINYLLMTLGCLVLALGSALFLVPNSLITGGLTSVAVIIQYFIRQSGSSFQAVDIVTWGFQVLFLGVSFIFLGRQYTLRTLYSSLLYPLFFTLFYRVQVVNGESLGVFIHNKMYLEAASYIGGANQMTILLLAALFGGALVGLGVALSFAGGGTTGGIDIIAVIVAKTTRIKEGIATFVIDGTLVLIGLFVMKDINLGLIGIISAFTCAAIIQFTYVNAGGFIIADVVTDKVAELKKYVEEEMDRTTTIFSAKGGYTEKERQVVRVAFAKREFSDFKLKIAEIDPAAFVTFVTASMIHGEGFDPLVTPDAKQLIKDASETRKRKK